MRISILGCGWLGIPLAERLLAEDFRVHGSTTTKDKTTLLEPLGITPFWITLNPKAEGDDIQEFLNSEILIINIPPGSHNESDEPFHVQQIKNLISHIESSAVNFVIYVSSTSVYPDLNQVITEEQPAEPQSISGRALMMAEQLLINHTAFDTTVIRFGGLYGPDRPPGRFLSGRSNLSKPETPVNLIHQEDCVEILWEIIRQDVRNQTFNACCDQHPTRKQFYTRAAEQLGLPMPSFSENSESSSPKRIISSDKLKDRIGYQFRHSL